jgi:large subunit ribosomal protein L25
MLTLNAEKRGLFGKKLAGSRREGKLPVVIYGPKEKSLSFFVDAKEFKKVWQSAGESSVISFKFDKDAKDVLIHEVTLDPISDAPVHVDFYAIEKGKALKVPVSLEFVGVSSAVKSLGGVLVKVLHEVEVEALPADLPHVITVDISKLNTFEDQITVKELPLPAGVKITFPHGDEIVALVAAPKEEKEEEAAAAAPDLTQIEIEKKGKKPEEGEAEATTQTPKK